MEQRQIIRPSNEEEWLNMRCGKITASEIWKIMKRSRVQGRMFSDTGMTYLMEKVADIICGYQKSMGGNAPSSVEWGKRHEPEAAKFLQNKGWIFEYYGCENQIYIPYNSYSGASPDGIMDGHIMEIKCPYTSYTHIENLLASRRTWESPTEKLEWFYKYRFDYLMQMIFNMICAGKRLAYFISYDPRPVNENWRLAIMEIEIDEVIEKEMLLRLEYAREIIIKELESLREL